MVKTKILKPFNTKGMNIVSATGEAEWCKYRPEQLQRGTYFPKGCYSTNVIFKPDDEAFLQYRAKLEAMLETAYNEIMNDEGAVTLSKADKGALVKVLPIKQYIKKEKDSDGKYTIEVPTDDFVISPKLNNIDDLDEGRNYVKLIGGDNNEVPQNKTMEIGNGSLIKVKCYTSPYYMAGKVMGGVKIPPVIGISIKLDAIKVIKLNSYSSNGEDFGDDDFEAEEREVSEGEDY